ncbi:glycosyltransferase [Megamonas sp.]|uniref:glycosyltransferase family 2 protein n=1 Tax=Megamonas sp. TaxID=2049033 RepID=UPI00257E11FB|nr:glycosyltransferase [Megamonas sp.]MBS5780313.1 glycosyltransferase [Megamonas sp.]
MKKIKYSIVIPTWNNYVQVNKLINLLVYAKLYCDNNFFVEIIIVDDTPEKMREEIYLNKNTIDGIYYKIIYNKENIGFTKSLNKAIKSSNGKILIILNDDIEIRQDFFFILENKSINILAPKLLYPDGRIQKSIRRFPSLLGFVFDKNKKEYFCNDFDYNKQQYVEQPMFSALIVKRELFFKIGYLDENNGYKLYFSDVDWCKRVALAGYSIEYNPDLIVIHHHGISGSKLGLYKELLWVKGLKRYIEKYGSSSEKFFIKYMFWVIVLGKIISKIKRNIGKKD